MNFPVVIATEKYLQLKRAFIDISERAPKEMRSNVTVEKLRLAILPPSQKHNFGEPFVRKVNEAQSVNDLIKVVLEQCDYLQYSPLKCIIDLYGHNKLKKDMVNHAMNVSDFRRETRLPVFLSIHSDRRIIDEHLLKMTTKHNISWNDATLEDVEVFRVEFCRELSLHEASMKFLNFAKGCVEITWSIPRSLVSYITEAMKFRSRTMMEHHKLLALTVDGVIIYPGNLLLAISIG